jgi:hypothetical protein
MAGLRAALSSSRFEAYRTNPGDDDIECLKRYVWNVALSEALYPTLQYLEIALRNGIHQAATTHFGTEYWFDVPTLITDPTTLKIISGAKGNLTKAGKPIEAGRVVAELHFGFWRQLFFNEYEKRLWRHIIKDVFPHAPKSQRQRAILGPRIHNAKELRNRIFHHEPVWKFQGLQQRHVEVLETISWINRPMEELARVTDRFSTAYEMDLKALEPVLSRIQL